MKLNHLNPTMTKQASQHRWTAIAFACIVLTALISTRACRAQAAASPSPTLDAQIKAAIKPFQGRVSLYAKNLDTGATYSLGGDNRVDTASTIKLSIMPEVYQLVSDGKLHWDDPIVMKASDKKGGTGIIAVLHDNLQLTLRDTVKLMMMLSDNTATNLTLDHIGSLGVNGADAVNANLDKLGITDIRCLRKIGGGGASKAAALPENKDFGIGVATPRAMEGLIEKMERGQLVNAASSKEMIDLLKQERDRWTIGRDVDNYPIASKSGTLGRLRSDVAILYTKRGRIAMAITCDQMPKAIWTIDNPADILMGRLGDILVDGLGDSE